MKFKKTLHSWTFDFLNLSLGWGTIRFFQRKIKYDTAHLVSTFSYHVKCKLQYRTKLMDFFFKNCLKFVVCSNFWSGNFRNNENIFKSESNQIWCSTWNSRKTFWVEVKSKRHQVESWVCLCEWEWMSTICILIGFRRQISRANGNLCATEQNRTERRRRKKVTQTNRKRGKKMLSKEVRIRHSVRL